MVSRLLVLSPSNHVYKWSSREWSKISNISTCGFGFLMCKKNTRSDCYVFFNSNECPFASWSSVKLIMYLCDIKLTKIAFICLVDIIECIDELCVITASGSWGTSVSNFDSLPLLFKTQHFFSSFHFVTDWLGMTHILINNFKN